MLNDCCINDDQDMTYHGYVMLDDPTTCPLCERVLWPGWSVRITLPGQEREVWAHPRCARRHERAQEAREPAAVKVSMRRHPSQL